MIGCRRRPPMRAGARRVPRPLHPLAPSSTPTTAWTAMRACGRARAYETYGRRAVIFPAGTFPQVPSTTRRCTRSTRSASSSTSRSSCCAGIPGPRIPIRRQHVELIDEVMYDFPELTFVMRHGAEPWTELAVKLMLKWPNLYYSTSAFAPKYYPKAIIDYANTRGADKVIYAGLLPDGAVARAHLRRAARTCRSRTRCGRSSCAATRAGARPGVMSTTVNGRTCAAPLAAPEAMSANQARTTPAPPARGHRARGGWCRRGPPDEGHRRARADVALGTVYRYFSSKDHLVAAALLEWARDLSTAPPAGVGGRPRPQGRPLGRPRDAWSPCSTRRWRAYQRRPVYARLLVMVATSTDANASRASRRCVPSCSARSRGGPSTTSSPTPGTAS